MDNLTLKTVLFNLNELTDYLVCNTEDVLKLVLLNTKYTDLNISQQSSSFSMRQMQEVGVGVKVDCSCSLPYYV